MSINPNGNSPINPEREWRRYNAKRLSDHPDLQEEAWTMNLPIANRLPNDTPETNDDLVITMDIIKFSQAMIDNGADQNGDGYLDFGEFQHLVTYFGRGFEETETKGDWIKQEDSEAYAWELVAQYHVFNNLNQDTSTTYTNDETGMVFQVLDAREIAAALMTQDASMTYEGETEMGHDGVLTSQERILGNDLINSPDNPTDSPILTQVHDPETEEITIVPVNTGREVLAAFFNIPRLHEVYEEHRPAWEAEHLPPPEDNPEESGTDSNI